MVDNNSIIEGTVKFRDGKKWKSRWCVMRKLSPVADCLHLQLYRDSKDRYKQGHTKASLSLEHFLGLEVGFTLDKESNTVAILCQDVVVVLAFDSRERLMQWQVKLNNHLGDAPHFLVLLSSAPPKARLQPGPARLHVQEYGFCLSTGVPPRVVGRWMVSHLRRYGVVEGRFCFEGGSRCGLGEGLYVLLTDQGEEIAATLKLASQGQLFTTRRRPVSRNISVTDSPRRSVAHSDTRKKELFDQSNLSRTDSPYTDLESNYGCGDVSLDSSWNVPSIERCMSCISKLGALSRSSTVATTPSVPCWEHSCDRHSLSSGSSDCSGWSQALTKPPRPPKPNSSSSPQRKVTSPPPLQPSFENYDVPSFPFPVARNTPLPSESKPDEHYDTPRKIKECLGGEAIRKPCGCVLRVRQPDQDRPCVCRRLITSCSNQEDPHALYATVDMSKKYPRTHNYANIRPNTVTNNYANMDFAKSLELYENAKQMTQSVATCNRCGHPQDDYLIMEPASRKNHHPPAGYLPMSPAVKRRLGKALSSSNPNLAPAIDRSGKPPGSAMLQTNVYQRKQLLDCTDNLERSRKRSNSADSGRCEETEASPCNCSQFVVRRSSSVPCKSNRDSSSSNDSGVFELPRRVAPCGVTTLPRRSKSSDPLRDLSFQFQKVEEHKSASAEAEVPVCPSESTSSATSDMSDYIETLSLSSHSSNEAPPPSCTLRPRSGNEYLSLQRLIAPVPEEHHN